MSYLSLSAIFLATAILVAAIAVAVRGPGRRARARRWVVPVVVAALVVLGLTAVFDNVMIASGLFVYDLTRASGLLIGRAPIEDFAYPVAGLILLPALWLLFGRKRREN